MGEGSGVAKSCGVCRSQTQLRSGVAAAVVEAGGNSDSTPSLGPPCATGVALKKKKKSRVLQNSYVNIFTQRKEPSKNESKMNIFLKCYSLGNRLNREGRELGDVGGKKEQEVSHHL